MVGFKFGDIVERDCSTVVLCIAILVLHPVLWYGVVLTIGFHSRILQVLITDTLTSQHYICEVLMVIE